MESMLRSQMFLLQKNLERRRGTKPAEVDQRLFGMIGGGSGIALQPAPPAAEAPPVRLLPRRDWYVICPPPTPPTSAI